MIVSDPSNIDLPDGYELLEVDGYAANFAPADKEFYLFIAKARNSLMFNTGVQTLTGKVSQDSAYGMVENFDASKNKGTINMKALDEELGKLANATYPMLVEQANELERQDKQNSLRKLFRHLLKTFPEELNSLVNRDTFTNLLNCIGSNLDQLKDPFQKKLNSPEADDFGRLLA